MESRSATVRAVVERIVLKETEEEAVLDMGIFASSLK